MVDVEGLRLTVLGSSGTYSSDESSCSGYLVRSKGAVVLLDTGPGSSMELQRHVDLRELDAIVVSHEHPDHWTELPCLYHGFRYGIQRSGVPTYGTAGTLRLLELVLPDSLTTAFDWTVIDASSALTIGDQSWTFSRTDQPVETLGPRVEANGRSLGYSADTGPGWSPWSVTINPAVFSLRTRSTSRPSRASSTAAVVSGRSSPSSGFAWRFRRRSMARGSRSAASSRSFDSRRFMGTF